MAESSLPDLRFEDGNVLIKLSSDPADWQLLHKDVLCASSPVLARSFEGGQAASKLVWHPIKQKPVEMWTLVMQFDQKMKTYFLEPERHAGDAQNERVEIARKIKDGLPWSAPPPKPASKVQTWDVQHVSDHNHHKCICDGCEDCQSPGGDTWDDMPEELAETYRIQEMHGGQQSPFSRYLWRSYSSRGNTFLCDTEWGVVRWTHYSSGTRQCVYDLLASDYTVKHFKMFFAILYGFPVSWTIPDTLYNSWGPRGIHGVALAAANIASYAHIFDCEAQVMGQLQSWLVLHPSTWKTTSFGWTELMTLAMTLRCGPIVLDSVRTEIMNARGSTTPRSTIAQRLGLTEQQLEAIAPSEAEAIVASMTDDSLLRPLMTGQLHGCIGEQYHHSNFDGDEEELTFVEVEGLCRLPEAIENWSHENPRRSDLNAKAADISTTIYTEWLTSRAIGPETINVGRPWPKYESDDSPYKDQVYFEKHVEQKYSVSYLAWQIQEASKSRNPYKIFGELAATKYVLETRPEADIRGNAALIRAVKNKLNGIVEYVAQQIEDWRKEREVWLRTQLSPQENQISGEGPEIQDMMFELGLFERDTNEVDAKATDHNPNDDISLRAVKHMTNKSSAFPYVALREEALPWVEEQPWVRKPIPNVNRTQASERFLREVGFTEEEQEVDEPPKQDLDLKPKKVTFTSERAGWHWRECGELTWDDVVHHFKYDKYD